MSQTQVAKKETIMTAGTKRPAGPAMSSPTLNPNAQEFVPMGLPALTPAHLPASVAKPADDDSQPMDEDVAPKMPEAVGVVLSDADVAAIKAIRAALPESQKIKYSLKQLMGMKPLDPHAEEFTPLWLRGIHSVHDFEMMQEDQPQTNQFSVHHRRAHHSSRAQKRQKMGIMSPTCVPKTISRTSHIKVRTVLPKA